MRVPNRKGFAFEDDAPMTEPNLWDVPKFANVGTSEQFVREYVELMKRTDGWERSQSA